MDGGDWGCPYIPRVCSGYNGLEREEPVKIKNLLESGKAGKMVT